MLISAGLLDLRGAPRAQSSNSRLNVIDLGFGCGDQSVYLTQLRRSSVRENDLDDSADEPHPFLLDSYTGLTISPSQFSFASERVYSYSGIDRTRVRLFCADAAKPGSWTPDIIEATLNAASQQAPTNVDSIPPKQSTWILALDTLYHFSPSREPIFRHAFYELHASMMTFDLLLTG